MDMSLLWVPATLIASAGQVARNTMQRRLTEKIGTVGATQVRFLYGFPFSLLFLLLMLGFTGEPLPRPGPGFAAFILLGALAQILATGLMLAAMRQRSFSVVTALIKTEAVQIAVFGLVFLGDRLPPVAIAAIVLATAGVILVTWSPRTAGDIRTGGILPVALGVAAGALFALSAVGFRGAILNLESGSAFLRATTALAWSLFLQTAILALWLLLFDRPALLGSLREWRSSVGAGFVGAAASQFWFIGFALTAAANVRTLALVEVLMAQAVSRRVFAQSATPREFAGMGLIVLGVLGILLTAH
ncbi:DMT family transporter [Enterovirga aerilata]|uniref:DMT family transporter n=1 Tax=Enterovirga aerilata TaxID=2730920 RepID=A0A849I4R3_9HYPH|nr:DMT family transporter [Enterovirga sp. DB1703]NNM74432.1 DMT family transporter [Enterovirga sp. DB1703]